jgi:hypothetical protein
MSNDVVQGFIPRRRLISEELGHNRGSTIFVASRSYVSDSAVTYQRTCVPKSSKVKQGHACSPLSGIDVQLLRHSNLQSE